MTDSTVAQFVDNSSDSLTISYVQNRHKISVTNIKRHDSRVEFIRLACFDELEAFADCHIDLYLRRKTWANIYTITIWQHGRVLRCVTFDSAYKCVQFANSAAQYLLVDIEPLF